MHEDNLIQNHTEKIATIGQKVEEHDKSIKSLQEWSNDFQKERAKEEKKLREQIHSLEQVMNKDIYDIKIGQMELGNKFDKLIAKLEGREEAEEKLAKMQCQKEQDNQSKLSLKYDEFSMKYGKWALYIGAIGLIIGTAISLGLIHL